MAPWIMLVALAAPPAEAAEVSTATETPVVELRLSDLKSGVSNALREQAAAQTDEARDAAATQLVAWYARVMLHGDLLPQHRSYLRGKLRTRLTAIERDLLKQAGRSSGDQSVEMSKERRAELLSAARKLALSGPTQGAGGGGAVHHGDELIELIQATIEPNSWVDLGGEGVIRLFAPGGVPR